MTPELWARIKEVVFQAEALPPSQRKDFLIQACMGDKELEQAAHRYLETGDVAFMDQPLFRVEPTATCCQPGSRLGPWRIERELGRGGMGSVYLAERADGAFQQRVAVKVLRRGLDTDDLIRRFQQERQILAQLNHPYVAGVVDGGATEDGRPYLVMEHVEGEALLDYCRRNMLSVRARLKLFVKICEAVDHAHRNLVVHRDIKPGNILVTAAGDPKLLDFGIAKLLTPDGGHTRTGASMMTPDYAAPEQISGAPVTTATDIYALGILLYEMLAGERPYTLDGASVTDISRLVCEKAPERPSLRVRRKGIALPGSDNRTLFRVLTGDLDNIVLFAMRKEPDRRYRSAAAMAEDIHRYLTDFPVKARKDTLTYLTGKFIRRNRLAASAVTALLLLLIGFNLKLADQQRNTMRQRDRAEQFNRLLMSVFTNTDPFQGGSKVVTARDLLDKSGWEVTRGLHDQPDAKADFLGMLSAAYISMGTPGRALSTAQNAFILRRDHKSTPEDIADAYSQYATALVFFDPLRAEQYARRAVEMWEDMPDKDPMKLSSAYAGLAGMLAARSQNGQTRDLVTLQCLWEESENLFCRALDIAQDRDNEPQIAANVSEYIGRLLNHQERFEEAEAFFLYSYRIRTRLGDDHPGLGASLNNLAIFYKKQGRFLEAEHMVRKSLDIARKTFGKHHEKTQAVQSNLAAILLKVDHLDEALGLMKDLVAHQEKEEGDPIRLAHTYNTFAATLLKDGRLEEAEESYLKGLVLVTGSKEGPAALTIAMMSGLSRVYVGMGRLDCADLLNRKAMERLCEVTPVGHSHRAHLHLQQGNIYRAGDRFQEAQISYTRALAIREKALGKHHPGVADVLFEQAVLYRKTGKLNEAEKASRRALTIRGATAHQFGVEKACTLLSQILREMGRFEEAEHYDTGENPATGEEDSNAGST
ncbi:MAG: serine/threonine-protein kinase [Acidobacteriota bacterium]|nr:serine/threonine-protein kinase [Acidobacteriota bacterium]